MKLRKKWICCVVTIIAIMMTFCFSACFSKKYSTADLPQTCTFTVQNGDGFDAQVGSLFDYEYAEMLVEGLNRCH